MHGQGGVDGVDRRWANMHSRPLVKVARWCKKEEFKREGDCDMDVCLATNGVS